jgi:hypothetical protein
MVRTWTLSLMAAGGLLLGIAGGASANSERCRTNRVGYTESYRSYDDGYRVYPVRSSDRYDRYDRYDGYDRYDRDDWRDRRRARELREERIERERDREHWRLERAREERLERRDRDRDHRSWDRLHHRWFE